MVIDACGRPPLPGDLLRLLPGAEDSAVVVAPLAPAFSALSTAVRRRWDGDLARREPTGDDSVIWPSESTVRSTSEASLVSGPNSACCCSRCMLCSRRRSRLSWVSGWGGSMGQRSRRGSGLTELIEFRPPGCWISSARGRVVARGFGVRASRLSTHMSLVSSGCGFMSLLS